MTKEQRAETLRLRSCGMSYGNIAKDLDVSIETVRAYCHRHRDQIPNGIQRCDNCGARIQQTPGRRKRRFCCDKCRNQWWNAHLDQVERKAYRHFTCQYCGKEFDAYGDRHRKYCCHDCYVADRFGGGIHYD